MQLFPWQNQQYVMLLVLQAQSQVSIRNKQLIIIKCFKIVQKCSIYDNSTSCGVHCSGDNLQDQAILQKYVQ